MKWIEDINAYPDIAVVQALREIANQLGEINKKLAKEAKWMNIFEILTILFGVLSIVCFGITLLSWMIGLEFEKINKKIDKLLKAKKG